MTAQRAVIFDLDNTLILEDASTFAAVRAAAQLAHTRRGIDVDAVATAVAETADRIWMASPVYERGHALGIWWGEALWGGFSGDDASMRAMRTFVPGFRVTVWREALARVGSTDDALAADLEAAYVAARRTAETIDPDAEPVLKDLARDHRLALLTNGAAEVQREKLSRTPFGPYFSTVVISGDVGIGKPDARIFQIAAERLGVTPSDAVYVGDSPARDVAGAHGAGMRVVWLDRGLWDERAPAPPDARIERLSDLRAALDALERLPSSPRATL